MQWSSEMTTNDETGTTPTVTPEQARQIAAAKRALYSGAEPSAVAKLSVEMAVVTLYLLSEPRAYMPEREAALREEEQVTELRARWLPKKTTSTPSPRT